MRNKCFHAKSSKLLDLAEASVVKASAYLDLCELKEGLARAQRELGVEQLGRTASMLWDLSLSSMDAEAMKGQKLTKFVTKLATLCGTPHKGQMAKAT
jgi:hypothetical protein